MLVCWQHPLLPALGAVQGVWFGCIILAAACMSGQDAALAVFLSLLFSVQDFPISLKAFSVRSKVNSYSKSELS